MIIYLSLIIALIVLGLLFFLGLTFSQDRMEVLKSLSRHFSGYVPRFRNLISRKLAFVGYFSGHKFTFTFGDAHSIIIEYFTLSESKMRIYMYRTDPGTVLFAKRIHVGDAFFNQYFIYSNMPSEAEQYLYDISRKSALKLLVQAGWDLPIITKRKIIIGAQNVTTEIAPQFIEEMLKQLSTLRN